MYEKYLQLARDANTQGDRVMAENYLQHAEHYFRILSAAQAQQAQYAAQNPQAVQQQQPNGNRPPNGSGEQPYVQGAPQPVVRRSRLPMAARAKKKRKRSPNSAASGRHPLRVGPEVPTYPLTGTAPSPGRS